MNPDRTDRVWLDPAEPRCSPSGVCAKRETCARALAPIPTGSTVEDFNKPSNAGVHPTYCLKYLTPSESLAKKKPAVREVRPWPVE